MIINCLLSTSILTFINEPYGTLHIAIDFHLRMLYLMSTFTRGFYSRYTVLIYIMALSISWSSPWSTSFKMGISLQTMREGDFPGLRASGACPLEHKKQAVLEKYCKRVSLVKTLMLQFVSWLLPSSGDISLLAEELTWVSYTWCSIIGGLFQSLLISSARI